MPGRRKGWSNAECRMQNAECRMQNAECRMRNAECRSTSSPLHSSFFILHSTFYLLPPTSYLLPRPEQRVRGLRPPGSDPLHDRLALRQALTSRDGAERAREVLEPP